MILPQDVCAKSTGNGCSRTLIRETIRKLNISGSSLAKRASGTAPVSRRFDVHGLMLGEDFCLVSLPYEHFSHTERWVDRTAPFGTTMTFSLTNGGRGYIGSDEGLAMGANGGYEAGALPNWSAHEVMSPNLGGPAVGSEQMIKGAIAALWA